MRIQRRNGIALIMIAMGILTLGIWSTFRGSRHTPQMADASVATLQRYARGEGYRYINITAIGNARVLLRAY